MSEDENNFGGIEIRARRTGITHSHNLWLCGQIKLGQEIIVATRNPKLLEKQMLRDFNLLIVCEPVVETNPILILFGRQRIYNNLYKIKLIA